MDSSMDDAGQDDTAHGMHIYQGPCSEFPYTLLSVSSLVIIPMAMV